MVQRCGGSVLRSVKVGGCGFQVWLKKSRKMLLPMKVGCLLRATDADVQPRDATLISQ